MIKLNYKTIAVLVLTMLSTFLKAQSPPANVPTKGLVGWWPFNGNANDESGNGNNLSVNGASLSTDRNGLSNNAYYFDGYSSNLKANLSLRTLPGLTISCWGNVSGSNNIQTLINLTSSNQLAAFGINYSYNAKTVDAYATPKALGKLSIQQNTWNHYLITTDYATMTSKFYCNGLLIGSSTSAIDTSLRTEFNVGMHHSDAWGYGWYFNGKLDDIGIWNRALSESEIKLLYNPASILLQPKNVVAKSASNAMFFVKTADSGVKYQWQTNTGNGFTNISNGGQFTGINNDTLLLNNIKKSNNHQEFRCLTFFSTYKDTSDVVKIIIPNVPNNVPLDGLISYWLFSGNAIDNSDNGNDGMIKGANLSNDRNGITDNAFSFDVSNNFILVQNSNSLNPTKAITIAAWIKANSWGNNLYDNTIVGKDFGTTGYDNAGYVLRCGDNGKLSFNIAKNGTEWPEAISPSGSMNTNKWYFVTGTFDGNQIKVYINGILVGTTNCISSLTPSKVDLTIGMRPYQFDRYFHGSIDDVGIWNRALSESEIKLLYNPASIIVQPKNVVSKIAENAMFIVKTADSGVTYQWQTYTGSGFTNISNGGQYKGASNDTLLVNNIQQANNNQQFRCIVKVGMAQETSNIANLLISNVPAYVPSSGLVAWWPFNGNALDSSGYGNHGQVKGATLTTDRNGNPNSAYEFNGSNNYINIANSELKKAINNVSQVTIVTWVNFTDLSLWGGGIFNHWQKGPVSNNVGLQFGYYGNKTMGVASLNGIGVPTTAAKLNQNEWVMLTCVYDGTQTNPKDRYKVYLGNNINVPLDCSNPGNCIFPNTTSPDANETYIGALTDGGSDAWMYFKGKIDDMGVWNRILSPEEITKLLNECKPSITQQPINKTVKEMEMAKFSVTSSDPNATYTWQGNTGFGFVNLFNAGSFSGVNNDTLIISNISQLNNNQQFRCIVNSGKCSDTSKSVILNVLKANSLSNYKASDVLQLFPNPSHGSIQLKVHPALIGQVFTISDIHGRDVFSGTIESDHQVIALDLKDNGIYVLQTANGFHYKFQFLKN